MKRCPTCNRTYQDDAQTFCLEDGGFLVKASEPLPSYDPNATARYNQAPSTNAPPEVYRQDRPLFNQVDVYSAPRLSPSNRPRSTSPAPKAVLALVFGILGFALCGIFGIVGIILGRQELDAIAAGQSSVAGSGFAKAGVITGWISLGLLVLWVVIFALSLAAGVK